ncbi:MAG: hypothetical protein HC843_02075 [Sphingomonadales bacterium]|nr:hypothetical protein [Sphingomonadales bacterium]
MSKPLDYTATWNDAVAMMKRHQSLILPIAGVFMFLPNVIMGAMLPQPEIQGDIDPNAALAILSEYFASLAPWLIGISILATIGNLAILHMVLGGKNPTVGEAITLGLGSFIAVFLAGIISTIGVTIGMLLLIVPGIYLAVKFSLVSPAVVAEGIKNPIDALSRSWAITKGNSLRVFGFYLIIGIVGFLLYFVATLVAGGLLGLISNILAVIVDGALSTILAVVFLFVVAAVYKQLTASDFHSPIS